MSQATRSFEGIRVAREIFFTIVQSAFVLALLKILGEGSDKLFFDLAYYLGYVLMVVYALFAGDRLVELISGSSEIEIESVWRRHSFRALSIACAAALAIFAVAAIDAAIVSELEKLGAS